MTASIGIIAQIFYRLLMQLRFVYLGQAWRNICIPSSPARDLEDVRRSTPMRRPK
jgi:hypothetical protein